MTDQFEKLKAALAGRYRIDHELGAGGMATVYLADDLKHDRKVAVKVLRPELAAVLGADRFVQEIKTTASLQHPHILPLFDSGEADGFLFYVMPYIDGETLRDKLDRETQLGVDEAVRITTEVADALDYAHRHNVIHRDIKPENILLHDGRPMVADFGIALAVSAAAGGRMTETGMSLGTPHYMSPEQATADKDITARSDVYSLGAVLYEMLTGHPPHVGSSAQQIIMRIVTDEARPVTELRKAVPPNVAAAVAQALEKLPADRFASAQAFRDALGNPAFARTRAGTSIQEAGDGRDWRIRMGVPLAVFSVLTSVALAWSLSRPRPAPLVQRFSVSLNERMWTPIYTSSLTISPDGSTIIYSAMLDDGPPQLWARRHDELVGQPIPGTENGATPAVSPDGQMLAWVQLQSGYGGPLMTARLTGGAPRIALERVDAFGLAWGPDGSLYYSSGDGLRRLTPDGETEVVTTVNRDAGEWIHYEPHVLPNNTGALFTLERVTNPLSAVVWFATGEIDTLAGVERAPRVVPTGHLVWVNTRHELMAARYDLRAARTTGAPVVVAEDLWTSRAGVYDVAISDNGTLMYRKGDNTGLAEPVWVDRTGQWDPVEPGWTFDPSVGAAGLALSPAGTTMVVTVLDNTADLWTKTFGSPMRNRLTFEGPSNYRPFWMPDGRTIAYLSTSDDGARNRVWVKPSDGSGSSEMLWELDESIHQAQASSDGTWLVYRIGSGTGDRDVYAVRLDQDGASPVPLAVTEFGERAPTLSPNDRWFAYVSDESGRDEVYVRPFPNASGGQWQVSTGGGVEPQWAPAGDELFYRNAQGDLVAVSVTTDGPFAVGERTVLFSAIPYVEDFNHWMYNVAPDGQRFLMLRIVQRSGDEIIWVSNWFEELEAALARDGG